MTPYSDVPTTYISAHSRARLVVILLIAGAIVSALTIPAELAEAFLIPFADDQEIEDNPAGFVLLLATFLLNLLTILIYIATVIVFSMWLYRSAQNLRSFGYWKSQIGYSPGWTVGSFFVPIANLFVPYLAIREVWQKSHPNSESFFPSTLSPPGFFPAWWTFWLLSNFASNVYFRMSLQDASPEATAVVGVTSEALSIGAAVFAIQVVKEITRRQEEAALTVSPAMPGPPPPPNFHSPQVGKENPT